MVAKLTINPTSIDFDSGKLMGKTNKRRAKDTKWRKYKCKKSVTKGRITSLMLKVFFTLAPLINGLVII